MILDPIDFDFGVCSTQNLPRSSLTQHSLHVSQDTTIQFTTIVNDVECKVHFTFHPFRRQCNLTYHEYEIHYWIPFGTSETTVHRQSIIETAQRIYEIYFFQNAGYKLNLLESELQTLGQSHKKRKGGKETHAHPDPSCGVSATTSHHLTILPWQPNRKPPPKYQTISDRQKQTFHSFVTWKPDDEISIQDVQQSYATAKGAGLLRSSTVPQLKPIDHPATARWDPYLLMKNSVSKALLDEEKLSKIQKQIRCATANVPKAKVWLAQTEKYKLTPMDLRAALLVAFGWADSRQAQQQPVKSNMPSILATAASLLGRADSLGIQKAVDEKAIAIARIVGYALMRVCEVVDELTPSQISDFMKEVFKGNTDYQKKSRNLGCFWCWTMSNLPEWKDRELSLYLLLSRSERALRDLFQPTSPAAAGELVSFLRSKVYSLDLPISPRVPSVIEIARRLIGDNVSNAIICRALGCPDEYLDAPEEYYSELFQFLDSPSTVPTLWRSIQSRLIQTAPPLNVTHFATSDLSISRATSEGGKDDCDNGVDALDTNNEEIRSADPILDLTICGTFDGDDLWSPTQLLDMDLTMASTLERDDFILPQPFNPVIDLNTDGIFNY